MATTALLRTSLRSVISMGVNFEKKIAPVIGNSTIFSNHDNARIQQKYQVKTNAYMFFKFNFYYYLMLYNAIFFLFHAINMTDYFVPL